MNRGDVHSTVHCTLYIECTFVHYTTLHYTMATTQHTPEYNDRVEQLTEFLGRYCEERISTLARRYPKEQRHLRVNYGDLFTFDADLAEAVKASPGDGLAWIGDALAEYSVPNVDLTDVTIRLVDLPDADTYRPLEVTKDRPEGYIAVKGDLSKVMDPRPEADILAFECLRCGTVTTIEQTGEEAREPSDCVGCDRQGPFEFNRSKSRFRDYTKVRVETPPDQTGDLQQEHIDGVVRGDLVWHGHEEHGLVARSGDTATIYGTVEYKQQDGRGVNDRLFDPYLDVHAVEFDGDDSDVDIPEHRETFEELAARPDAVDVFAESLVPELYATPEWEAALEALVAYLFGAPRIDIPEGPTYRGDIHVLIMSDYGMGKSMVNSSVADFSPTCIKESVTGMASDVGLLAAAVEDDFGDGQWTLSPGILVRANGGHVILDEIDKTDADLERMNDALEGEQVVDVNKAGQSATFKSRVGLLATGNPKESRFDKNQPVSDQLGIDRSLLSRFDAIITMRDDPDEEQDANVAEAQGRSYVEAQEYQHGDREEFEHLDRVVDPAVGRAWVQYARDEVTPKLRTEQVDRIRDWYAEEVRQLNHELRKGENDDMPAPASPRSVMDTIRFAVAFARVHLRGEVADADVERAMSLSKTLIGQTFDGDKFAPEASKPSPTTQADRIDAVMNAIDGQTLSIDEVAMSTKLDAKTAEKTLEHLAENGRALRKDGGYRGV